MPKSLPLLLLLAASASATATTSWTQADVQRAALHIARQAIAIALHASLPRDETANEPSAMRANVPSVGTTEPPPGGMAVLPSGSGAELAFGSLAELPAGATVELPPGRVGTFVTLEVKGQVRGCRGTLEPMQPTVAEEIRHNALAAALHDPTHRPLTAKELPNARISVTVVERLVPLSELTEVLSQDGLVVRAGDQVGVVLPYEGRDVATRLRWGLQKAGLRREASYDLYRMIAIRFAEGMR